MINTIADILDELRNAELRVIARHSDTKHPGLIGDMYEGLSRKMIERTIPSNLDLRVVDGKIRNEKGKYSRQIDCMIVVGDGERLPNTDHFIYDIKQVVAVIEVKANLYSGTLASAYENLLSVSTISDPKVISSSLVVDAYNSIVGEIGPDYDQLSVRPLQNQMIFHVLVTEAMRPIRIVLGYQGFKTEANLRKSFIEHLGLYVADPATASVPKGFGPGSLPNLILAGANGILKLNGMPYAAQRDEEGYWPLCASFGSNGLLHLLELIWTKLCYQHGVSDSIFGDDLDAHPVHPLIRCRYAQEGMLNGWEYAYFDANEDDLVDDSSVRPWEPLELDPVSAAVLTRLLEDDLIVGGRSTCLF